LTTWLSDAIVNIWGTAGCGSPILLCSTCKVIPAPLRTLTNNLDVVPSDIALAGSEIELVDLARRERRLEYAVEALESDDDYVLIDSPPSLGLLAINAVVAADALLIPIQCEFYALEGLGLLMHTLTLLRRELNPTLGIAGIVMTLFDARLALAHQVVEEVRARFGDQLLTPLIPRNVRLSEAPSHGMPITLYDPSCRGAIAYRELSANLDARIRGRYEVDHTGAGAELNQADPVDAAFFSKAEYARVEVEHARLVAAFAQFRKTAAGERSIEGLWHLIGTLIDAFSLSGVSAYETDLGG